MLRLDAVRKRYTAGGGSSVSAVDGVSLTVAAGELVVLSGPSGSGKTTLLHLAAALMPPDSGTITLDGRDVSRLTPDEADDYRRLSVGFIFQDTYLMPSVSIAENAALKLLVDPISIAEARRRAEPWLARVGLGDRLRSVPQELSGGERQRVAIALALANEPPLVLADEPTSSLDSRSGLAILSMLREIAHERRAAVLVVTHDPQAEEIADRTLHMRDGRLLPADADASRASLAQTQPDE
jgi:ABC-type lipoprotein export system ATPase subunit